MASGGSQDFNQLVAREVALWRPEHRPVSSCELRGCGKVMLIEQRSRCVGPAGDSHAIGDTELTGNRDGTFVFEVTGDVVLPIAGGAVIESEVYEFVPEEMLMFDWETIAWEGGVVGRELERANEGTKLMFDHSDDNLGPEHFARSWRAGAWCMTGWKHLWPENQWSGMRRSGRRTSFDMAGGPSPPSTCNSAGPARDRRAGGKDQ